MICDPLTKAGSVKFAERLVTCMATGWFDARATPESILKKLAKQKQSKSMKELRTKSDADGEWDTDALNANDVDYYWQ